MRGVDASGRDLEGTNIIFSRSYRYTYYIVCIVNISNEIKLLKSHLNSVSWAYLLKIDRCTFLKFRPPAPMRFV